MSEPTLDIELLTIDELADLLKVKKSWVYDRVQDGSIPSIKLGGHRRFRRSEIAAYLDALAKQAS